MNESVALLVGLPGQGMRLGADPVSAPFVLLLMAQLLAAAVGGLARRPWFWLFAAGALLGLLAADAFALILGVELAGVAAWLARRGAAFGVPEAVALACGFALVPLAFLPPGTAAFLCLLLAAGTPAVLAPLWRRTMPARMAAGLCGLEVVALYLLVRYGMGAFGGAAAPWWGVALAAAGAAAALAGGAGALLTVEMKALLASAAVGRVGLILVALGLALWGKAVGHPALAALALQGALLGVLAHGLITPLLLLGVAAVEEATGTTSLDWLGGLLRGMPRLGLLLLAGAAGMAALPPGPGFPGLFLLLHAVLGGAAGAGLPACLGLALLAAALGLSFGLGVAASVRLVGIGFLGRPRSLAAAAAGEADARTLAAMGLLAALSVAPALLPGALLAATWPAVALLAPGAAAEPLGYAPAPLLVLMLAVAGAAFAALRRLGARRVQEAAVWNGGFGKPPAWLPFGEPATQMNATGFAAPPRALLEPARRFLPDRAWRLPRRPGWRRRLVAALPVLGFVALVAVLAANGIGSGL